MALIEILRLNVRVSTELIELGFASGRRPSNNVAIPTYLDATSQINEVLPQSFS